MDPLTGLAAAILATFAEWQALDPADTRFSQSRVAAAVLAMLGALTLLVLLGRSLRSPDAGRGRVALPALPSGVGGSPLSMLRHVPILMFLSGIPFFAFALADPYTAFTHQQVSHPGRRIAVMLDASLSMNQPFVAARLNPQGGQTYFATVAAAEYFMKLRMAGPYRDLVALIEFGNEAYVVTPFTSDYDNILLSMRLIAAPAEWDRFPDQGTVILEAIRQAMQLFVAFKFLDASGNLMVIFSDGQDTQTLLNGMSINVVMAEARRHNIPVYFIRMPFKKSPGTTIDSDGIWREAVARTGGKFYAADDEKTVLRAVHEIDELAPGRIYVSEYRVQNPRFAAYTLPAVALWMMAAFIKLGLRVFRSFP